MDQHSETFLEYRTLLFSIAYNMLGNVDAAEDIVQDTFLKWMEMPVENVQHRKAYLVKMVTNKCINYLHSARLQREAYIGIWLPEPLQERAANPYRQVEMYHALSIGMMVLLEKLTPQERAIFLLKEVFSYDYYELAGIFDKSEDNCRQILKRAKANLGKDARRFEVDIKTHEKILQQFLLAATEGNVDALVQLLKEDITLFADGGGTVTAVNRKRLTAPRRPVHGQDNVIRLLKNVVPVYYSNMPDIVREITLVNGLPSVISWSGVTAVSIVSIELEGAQIRNIYIQTNPGKLKRFNKPSQ
ncbi:MAG TPA: RNA polymerase sigma factor SigJ [Chitinophaga sp.]|uniref:RNA polymerase sigma factor SigJ n=1 Tax=Chitinophaga sp. TaxID=1869181 RepID=UPI002DBAA6E4|nr:RNA polymerase sigma factor SigJ [Chitinophaga sp.]HEU4553530.1 RNA polymerase sigma factor SigJ [Chitinophaga sp.]